MALIPCKCTNCGVVQTVDETKDAAICNTCGSAFVVAKAIEMYLASEEAKIDDTLETTDVNVEFVKPGNKGKRKISKPLIVVLCCAVIAAVAALVFATTWPPVESIGMSHRNIEMEAGSTYQIKAYCYPSNAKRTKLHWTSSASSVVRVDDNGIATAKIPGNCIITASTSNGVKKTCHITVVAAQPSKSSGLEAVYERFEHTIYCTYADDGSYLMLDTNPSDEGGDWGSLALDCIKEANEMLGFPESLLAKMTQTRALDGRQTETYNGYTVSWTYHPDSGLEVMYEVAR